MPIYRCKCKNCNFENEVIMSMRDRSFTRDIRRCPKCNKEEFRFVLGRTSFSLKGKGWYKDGYSK